MTAYSSAFDGFFFRFVVEDMRRYGRTEPEVHQLSESSIKKARI